ncbi:MAG: metal-dependent transcriptional regulator [Candidatus Micrarchaeota archaeon]|nr:metal-dependent transcriptional regulator [Candidatus Micrarchaeota archaeon]
MKNTAIEDYITAVYRIEKNNGNTRSKDIVDYLKIGKSSVSEMIVKLVNLGMVEHGKYSTITLTKKGKLLATKVLFKHRVIELFLTKMLDRNRNEVHQEAHVLEHAFSDQSIEKIYKILGQPKKGVHGEEIPEVKL